MWIVIALSLFTSMLTADLAAAQPMDSGAVVDSYTAALNAGDVEAALAFVSDDAVYMRPAGHFVGKDQVRGFIESIIERGAQIELQGDREVYGEYVRWNSRVTFTNPGSGPTESRNRSQSIVHEGKILFHMATPAQ